MQDVNVEVSRFKTNAVSDMDILRIRTNNIEESFFDYNVAFNASEIMLVPPVKKYAFLV